MAYLRVAQFANKENISGELLLDQRSPPKINVKQEDIDYRPSSSSSRRKSCQESSPEKETDRERKLGPDDKVDNKVSVRCRTSNGNTEKEEMRRMGLPTDFTSESENAKSHCLEEETIQETGRKGEKKTFYCKICLTELNSYATMKSHINGSKHMKKKLSISHEMEEAAKRGEPVPKAPLRVIQIPNPEPIHPESTRVREPARRPIEIFGGLLKPGGQLKDETFNYLWPPKEMEAYLDFRGLKIGRPFWVPVRLGGLIKLSGPMPEPLKKVPRRLHEKIKETLEPVVGLKFVEEYRAVSDIEMEAHYECHMCQKKGQANVIFTHIMGAKHRQKFLDHKFENDQKYMDLSQSDLLNMATKYRENHLNLDDVITTHDSDELYPWPPGKEPWSLENGGTGIAPDNARQNYGKVKKEKFEKRLKQNYGNSSPEVKRERKMRKQNDCRPSPEETMSSGISIPEAIKSPSCIKEAEQYIELGSKMLKLVLDSDWLPGKERRIHKANLASIVNISAAQIEKVKYKESHSDKNRQSKDEFRLTSRSPQTSPETSASFGSFQSSSQFGSLQRSPEANHRIKRARPHSRSSSPSSARNYQRRT